ncbi:hypothetical protein D3C72_1751910 [compost metagenome]
MVARGEAARRERQRHAAPDKGFDANAARPRRRQRGQRAAVHFHRHDAAGRAQSGQPGQRVGVVDVQVRAGDESPPAHAAHRAQVIGLDQVAVLLAGAAHPGDVGIGLHQHRRGQHHLLAGIAQHLRDLQPLRVAQFVAPRADGLAEVDAFHRGIGDRGVELQHALARPVVQQRAEGDAELRGGM